MQAEKKSCVEYKLLFILISGRRFYCSVIVIIIIMVKRRHLKARVESESECNGRYVW